MIARGEAMNTEQLAARLVQALNERGLHISTAESCTGGMIAAAITEVSGASAVFELGVVSYSDDIKNRVLQVSRETLERFTVYSAETAAEMVDGVLRLGGADIGIAVTGLAGPGGGTVERPVGLVYIAVGHEADLQVREFHFAGGRSDIRRQTMENALQMAVDYIEKL